MAVLQVRDIDDRLYEALKTLAKSRHRSVSQEVVNILERSLSNPDIDSIHQTDAFLDLSGAWIDDRSADDIVDEIRKSRKNSSRFEASHELFD